MQLRTELKKLNISGHKTVWDSIRVSLREIQAGGKSVLRWGLVGLSGQEALLEIATIGIDSAPPEDAAVANPSGNAGIHVAFVVPTGVGAAVGGFIGDAGPIARTLEVVADTVIVHPNVVNAADFYGGGHRSLYVDGLTLDRFFSGNVRLGPSRPVKIGLIIDRLGPNEEAQILNATNGLRAVRGVEVTCYFVCEDKIRSTISKSPLGHYIGEVENPEILFRAAQMLQHEGANALAVVTGITGLKEADLHRHYSGIGPNPVGALEALISRSITWKTGLPCAHAPAFLEGLGVSSEVIDPRAACEVVSGSGLPCLLEGLGHGPQIVETGGISVHDLSAVIVPFSCAGGPPALAAHRFGIPLLAIRGNSTTVGASADLLGVETTVVVENYAEAVAFVACAKSSVSWNSIRRPMGAVRQVHGSENPSVASRTL